MPVDKKIRYENLPSNKTGENTLVAEGKNRIEELLELEDWLNEIDPKYWLPEEDDKKAPSEEAEFQRRVIFKRYADSGGELNYPNFIKLIQGTLKKDKGVTDLI